MHSGALPCINYPQLPVYWAHVAKTNAAQINPSCSSCGAVALEGKTIVNYNSLVMMTQKQGLTSQEFQIVVNIFS